ncbi:hypothetical protein N9250_03085 [bacterium]|nr:hypothetical protein [bacterium]
MDERELLLNLSFGCSLAFVAYLFWLVINWSACLAGRERWISVGQGEKKQLIADIANTLAASVILVVLLKSTIESVYMDHIGIDSNLIRKGYFLGIISALSIFTVVCLMKRGATPLTTCLAIMLAFSCWNTLFRMQSLENKGASILDQAWNRADNLPFFKVKPDVFCFVVESYPSELALQRIFGFDNSAFIAGLEKRGFIVQDNFHSNGIATFESYVDLLAMEDQPIRKRDLSFQRSLMGGHGYVPALSVFKKNQYRIHSAFPNHNYTRHPMHSVYDNCFIFGSRDDASLFQSHRIPSYISRILWPYSNLSSWLFPPAANGYSDYDTLVENCVSQGLKEGPDFCLIKLDSLIHSGHLLTEWNPATQQSLSDFAEDFKSRIPVANTRILDLIDRITRSNHDSVIMLIGDHGANRYRPLTRHPSEYGSNPNKAFALWGINGRSHPSVQDIALDRFSVLYSIHYPTNVPLPLDSQPVTTVNTFGHLFSQLSDNAGHYERNKAPDNSYWYDMPGYVRTRKEGLPEERFKALSNGIALGQWVKADKPKEQSGSSDLPP